MSGPNPQLTGSGIIHPLPAAPLADIGVDIGVLLRLDAAATIEARAGSCARPILVTRTGVLIDADTGRVLDNGDPGTVQVRCRNRRAAVCPSCSALYRLDALHLIAAGLRGGKDTPEQVAVHPRLLLTLTAPSFGKIHTGRAVPVDPATYDYAGQVLFNAHAGILWAKFARQARRELAKAAGLGRMEAARSVRIVFAKVAEFQARGVVHIHAVVRLDGAGGPASDPPTWATVAALRIALRRAARKTTVTVPVSRLTAGRVLRWGRQLDITPITVGDSVTSASAVARYVAKYATKSTEAAGIDIPPISCRTCKGAGVGRSGLCRTCGGSGRRPGRHLDHLTDHVRTLVDVCWRLGVQPEYATLSLRRWAHQLGFHGHFATKSRTYSTTFAALRGERREHAINLWRTRVGVDPAVSLRVVGDWRYIRRDTTATHDDMPSTSDNTGVGRGR